MQLLLFLTAIGDSPFILLKTKIKNTLSLKFYNFCYWGLHIFNKMPSHDHYITLLTVLLCKR